MKKTLVVCVIVCCFLMTACSDDGPTTYTVTESDLESVYAEGYKHGYSDHSFYEAEKFEDVSDKYFQVFLDEFEPGHKVTGADIYTELYENRLIPYSVERDEVEVPETKDMSIPYESIGE